SRNSVYPATERPQHSLELISSQHFSRALSKKLCAGLRAEGSGGRTRPSRLRVNRAASVERDDRCDYFDLMADRGRERPKGHLAAAAERVDHGALRVERHLR